MRYCVPRSTFPQNQGLDCGQKYPRELKNSHAASGIGPQKRMFYVLKVGIQAATLSHISLEQEQYCNCTEISSNQQDQLPFLVVMKSNKWITIYYRFSTLYPEGIHLLLEVLQLLQRFDKASQPFLVQTQLNLTLENLTHSYILRGTCPI